MSDDQTEQLSNRKRDTAFTEYTQLTTPSSGNLTLSESNNNPVPEFIPDLSPPELQSSVGRRRNLGRRPASAPQGSSLVSIASVMSERTKKSYFTNYTRGKGLLYFTATLYVSAVMCVAFVEPFMTLPCGNDKVPELEYSNPAYNQDPCMNTRLAVLLFMTPMECSFGRRISMSALMGSLIGWERRSADRPAGIRTMALASLGACLFSICSAFAFTDGSMEWDGSRVAAAVPSGVGFLGAGIIWKQADAETNRQSVHGLTTAASLWLSAAVGISCAGELYVPAGFAIGVMMLLLRFGPRIAGDEDGDGNMFSSVRDEEVGYLRPSFTSYRAVDSTPSTTEENDSSRSLGNQSGPTSPRNRKNMPSIRE